MRRGRNKEPAANELEEAEQKTKNDNSKKNLKKNFRPSTV